MRIEYVEYFVQAAYEITEELTGAQPSCGPTALREKLVTTQQISIVAGITGKILGQAIYGMSIDTATNLASALIGERLTELDAAGTIALAEFADTITVRGAEGLSRTGFTCDTAPPSVLRGTNIEMSMYFPILVVPINTTCGEIEITVSLGEVGQKAA